jgi:hypothetical protein
MASDDDLKAGIVQIISPTEIGTGFVVSDTGLITTCSHVVQSEESQLRGDPRPEKVSILFFANGQKGVARIVPEWWRPANGDGVNPSEKTTS